MNIHIRDENFLKITVEEEYYFFQYHHSTNDQYLIAYSEQVIPLVGNYFLLNGHRVVTHGTLKRPHDGKVGNNGNFILNDWLSRKTRSNIAYAFNEMGNELIHSRLKAALLNNGLSTSGRFAIFQTANSNNEHSNMMFLYDLQGKSLIWKHKGGPNWPTEYEIDDEQNITIKYKLRPKVILDWAGFICHSKEKISSLPWVDERGV